MIMMMMIESVVNLQICTNVSSILNKYALATTSPKVDTCNQDYNHFASSLILTLYTFKLSTLYSFVCVCIYAEN